MDILPHSVDDFVELENGIVMYYDTVKEWSFIAAPLFTLKPIIHVMRISLVPKMLLLVSLAANNTGVLIQTSALPPLESLLKTMLLQDAKNRVFNFTDCK